MIKCHFQLHEQHVIRRVVRDFLNDYLFVQIPNTRDCTVALSLKRATVSFQQPLRLNSKRSNNNMCDCATCCSSSNRKQTITTYPRKIFELCNGYVTLEAENSSASICWSKIRNNTMSRQRKTAGRRKGRQPLVALKEESKPSVVSSTELDAPQSTPASTSSPFVIRSRTTVTPRFDFKVSKTQGNYRRPSARRNSIDILKL